MALQCRSCNGGSAMNTGGDLVSTQVLKQHRACRGPESS